MYSTDERTPHPSKILRTVSRPVPACTPGSVGDTADVVRAVDMDDSGVDGASVDRSGMVDGLIHDSFLTALRL
jgi:hypothetical protein